MLTVPISSLQVIFSTESQDRVAPN
ncbi:hypothetical protein FAIPA1_250078 [Frankia sp. AiPs1]